MISDPSSATSRSRTLLVKEAINEYRLSRSTLYKMMKEGTLHTVKVGGRRLIPRDAMEELIKGDVQ